MNWLDVLILLTCAWYFYQGARSGFLKIIFALGGLLSGAILAFLSFQKLSPVIKNVFTPPDFLAEILSFIFIWTVFYLAFSFLGKKIITLIRATPLGKIDLVLGGILGILRGILVVALALFLISLLGSVSLLPGFLKTASGESYFFQQLAVSFKEILKTLNQIFPTGSINPNHLLDQIKNIRQ